MTQQVFSKFQQAVLEGKGFLSWNLWENVTANKKVFARFTTPALKVVDMDLAITTEGEGTSKLFEENSFGASGTTLNSYNWKRRKDATADMVCQSYNTDSNITSTGSTVWMDYVNGHSRGNQEIGGAIEAHGLLLKTDTEYVLEMENRESSEKDIFMKVSWEEDTP